MLCSTVNMIAQNYFKMLVAAAADVLRGQNGLN